jgi:Uma2 family endonuclease
MTLLTPATPPATLPDPPDEKLYELIDGVWVEKAMSVLSDYVNGQFIYELNRYLRANPVGHVLVEPFLYCFPNRPNHARRPDSCYISRERLPTLPAQGHLQVAPELAIEVVSPNDNVFELETKLAEYFGVGVRAVWTAFPEQKMVRVERADGTARRYATNDTLDGQDVLPGFACPVADLFPKA